MRQIPGYPLWVGNVGDVRNLRSVLSAGIQALVDLAVNEPPVVVLRELVYCRFPLLDGAGNPLWLLRLAAETVAGLIRAGTPPLVFCGAGMSRSPAISAAALALVSDRSPGECLKTVAGFAAVDVSAGLWRDVVAALA